MSHATNDNSNNPIIVDKALPTNSINNSLINKMDSQIENLQMAIANKDHSIRPYSILSPQPRTSAMYYSNCGEEYLESYLKELEKD